MKSILTVVFLIMSLGAIKASEKNNCLFAYSKFKALVATCKNAHTNGFFIPENNPDSRRRRCIEQFHSEFVKECYQETSAKAKESLLN